MAIDMILGGAGLIVGILLILGKGDFLMKGADEVKRRKIYDVDKVNKAFGVGLLLVSLGTFVNAFVNVSTFALIYVIYMAVVFVAVGVYINKKCKKGGK